MTGWTKQQTAELFAALDAELHAAQGLRRQLHAEPRLSGDEDDTTTALLDALAVEGERLDFGGALVRVGAADGPAVGVRAELDALPVAESTGVLWRSRNSAMHACGHDVHLAAAVALARALRTTPGPMPLLLVLQPREETLPSGARDVVTHPEFEQHEVRAMIGAHVQPTLEAGTFAATGGPVNAAADQFTIDVHGHPGHAAYPHLTADPVVAAANLIGTLQHLISRQVNPVHPTVLTIGSINGGKSANVVPSTVRMRGILRTFDERDRVTLHHAIEETTRAVTNIHGCDAAVEVSLGAPVLKNDQALATATTQLLVRAGMTSAPPLRSCGADDFSFFCARVPSLMVFVGVDSLTGTDPGLHHPDFLPPDEAVGEVARALLGGYLAACRTTLAAAG